VSDKLTRRDRSALMSRVRTRDTGPELSFRKAIHKKGYRYRLHRSDLPGKPDVVFVARRKVIFIHGCFWHGHSDCRKGKRPVTNVDFWNCKIEKNRERDARNQEALIGLGWSSFVLWECEINANVFDSALEFLDR